MSRGVYCPSWVSRQRWERGPTWVVGAKCLLVVCASSTCCGIDEEALTPVCTQRYGNEFQAKLNIHRRKINFNGPAI